MRTSLHRRIVVAYRLRLLGSADSLLWAVSLHTKQSFRLFGACYDFATLSQQKAWLLALMLLIQDQQ